jgi:hypothetical protein
LALATFTGLEADILFRILVLIPCNGYSVFYSLTPEVLKAIWAVSAPLITPFKVVLSTIISVLLVPRIENQVENIEFSV